MKILWGNGYARAAVLGSVVALILTLGDDGLCADSARPVHLRLAYSAMTVNQAIPATGDRVRRQGRQGQTFRACDRVRLLLADFTERTHPISTKGPT